MNWDAVAAIGELVGGLAVIISLVYLATQIRISNKIAVGESQRATFNLHDFFGVLLQDQHRDVFVRGLDDLESLTLDERLRFTAIVHPLVNQMQAIYLDWNQGLQIESVNSSWQRAMVATLATKGGNSWWETGRAMFTDEYVQYIDDQLANDNPLPLNIVFPEYGLEPAKVE